MKPETLNIIIGAAALLLALHLTATPVLCYLLGALVMAALSGGDEPTTKDR